MTERRLVVGVMGAGEGASPTDIALAEMLGELIAREGWVVLTGGRAVGIMLAANRGAKRVPGSITLGISPRRERTVDDDAAGVDISVFTGMGDGRNIINVLSSDVVVCCGGGGPGTASEAALALKSGRALLWLAPSPQAEAYFQTLGRVGVARTPEQVVELIRAQSAL